MFDSIKLDAKGIKMVKPLLIRTFPNYNGRKVYVDFSSKPIDMAVGWDGEGNCSELVAIELATLAVIPVPRNGTVMEAEAGNRKRINDTVVPPGVAVVRLSRYGSGNKIVTIHVNPASKGMMVEAKLAIGMAS